MVGTFSTGAKTGANEHLQATMADHNLDTAMATEEDTTETDQKASDQVRAGLLTALLECSPSPTCHDHTLHNMDTSTRKTRWRQR